MKNECQKGTIYSQAGLNSLFRARKQCLVSLHSFAVHKEEKESLLTRV